MNKENNIEKILLINLKVNLDKNKLNYTKIVMNYT